MNAFKLIVLFAFLAISEASISQCTFYTITVAGNDADETSWQLFNSNGVMVASGADEDEFDICLPDDCYTLLMFDSNGDGWENTDWFIADFTGNFDFDTNLPNGFSGSDNFELGTGNCGGGGGGGCPSGTLPIDIVVNGGSFPDEIIWNLSLNGVQYASGGDGTENNICLFPGCYEFNMFDQGGDGWFDGFYEIYDQNGDLIASGGLADGFSGTDIISVGGVDCSGVGNNGCPSGTSYFELYTVGVTFTDEVFWEIAQNGSVLYAGGSPELNTFCLSPGCYDFNMYDAAGDGWGDNYYELWDEFGTPIYSNFLIDGFEGTDQWLINVLDCNNTVAPIAGSDCAAAVPVCDPFTFHISPSGFGTVDEIPTPGGVSNPNFGVTAPPWGGTDMGCLLAGELNSSWLKITITGSGSLGFIFGANGTQIGFYDWSMWQYTGPATCNAIANNTLAPVRCLWNATSIGGTGLANTIPAGGSVGNFGPQLNVTAGQQYIICLSNYSFVNTNVILDFIGTAIVDCAPIILPVEMTQLHGRQVGKVNWIEWETLSEINNQGFLVQRSIDGSTWEDLGFVDGHGTTQIDQSYSFPDANAPERVICYYRLKQYDTNGTFRYSEEIELYKESYNDAIYPNPAGDWFCLSNYSDETVTVSIYDISGKKVAAYQLNGEYQQKMDITNLSSGVYMVDIQSSLSRQQTKLIIQR